MEPLTSPSTINLSIEKFSSEGIVSKNDVLAIEEPFEIRLSFIEDSIRKEKNISITMRTPGHDEELAIGFLLTEGIIKNNEQIHAIHSPQENVIIISLKENVGVEIKKLERHFYTSSSCGVCGKASIDAIKTTSAKSENRSTKRFHSEIILKLPAKLRSHQEVFEQTGGLHASALFDAEGNLLLLMEDVGRHNALDKLIGKALIKKLLPLKDSILLLSGRASFELIQKATMAGIELVAAVGAPSSLAVSLAKERNMTLIGFLKSDKFNIYCTNHHIQF